MLKEILAEEGVGDCITIKNESYQNKKIPFLRLIDTVGIELKEENGPKKILENAINYIQSQRLEKNQDYNNYINCIWYCVKGNDIEEEEIEIINNLKKKESHLPIIVVNTFKIEKEENSVIMQKLLEKFGDIKFTQLLSRSTDQGAPSYGLDDLIDITLEECNNVVKGDTFNKMKEQISKEIENNIKEQNKLIQENIKNQIIPNFFNYKNYKSKEGFQKYIFSYYLEKIFLEYLKINKEKNNELSFENKNELENFENVKKNIKEYADFYEKETNKIVDLILNEKIIKYLDLQVGLEKKENKNIKIENKNNDKDFEEIIKTFLNNNFHFIAQKQYLDYINNDMFESLIKDIEVGIISKVNFLLKNELEDLFKNIYKIKFEDFKNWINSDYRKDNKNIYSSFINRIINQNEKIEKSEKGSRDNILVKQTPEKTGSLNSNMTPNKTRGKPENPKNNIAIQNTPENGNIFYLSDNDKNSEKNISFKEKPKGKESINYLYNNDSIKIGPGPNI